MGSKIILFHNVITPTRTMFFNKLNSMLLEQGHTFKVFFTSKTESNRDWDIDSEMNKMEFDYQILAGKQFVSKSKNDKHYFHINDNIFGLLNKENPDIIIYDGWASLSAWICLFWTKKNNKKYILWNESTKYENSWRRMITKPLVKLLVKKSDGYVSFGTRAKEYLESLGAEESKIQEIYNVIDTDFFLKEYQKLKNKKIELKSKYGIKTKYVLLFVGQIIKRKGVYEILEGFRLYKKKNKDISLVFVGDGLEKENLEKIIKEKEIKDVFFPGFLQIDRISEFYAIADIFTLPSKEEVWGYVINEAMCFGLPILTAYKVGSSVDLVKEGENGYIMKDNTISEFLKGLEYIFNNGLINNNNSIDIVKPFKIDSLINRIKI